MRFHYTFFLTFMAVLVSFAVSAQPFSPVITEGAGCDPLVLDSIEARAELQGQREVEVAQRLILKPDSVLEYSCFLDSVADLAAGSVFGFGIPALDSEGRAIFDSDGDIVLKPKLPEDLDRLVVKPFYDYDEANFGYKYAGNTAASGGVCASMKAIWDFLECEEVNLFVTLADLPGVDVRDQPEVCSNPAVRSEKLAVLLELANPPPAEIPFAGVQTIDYKAANDVINFSGDCSAAPPIFTGLLFERRGKVYKDAVCAVPGCHYSLNACVP